MVYIRHLRVWKYPVERLLSEAGVTGYIIRGIGLIYETGYQGSAYGSNGPYMGAFLTIDAGKVTDLMVIKRDSFEQYQL